MTSRGALLVPVLGNHDCMSDEQSAILTEVGRERTWYVDQVGIVRILVLGTEQVDNLAQTTWLQETPASPTDAVWTIVAMHKPAYSAGFHGSDEEIQQQWVPLFEQYVDVLAEDERLTLRAIDQSGMLLDSLELTR